MVSRLANTLRQNLCAGTGMAAAAAAMLLLVSCQGKPVKPEPSAPINPTLPAQKTLPEYLHGTMMDYALLDKTNQFVVTSYGLVVNLRGTGNSDSATAVHQWMVKEMLRHGWGFQRIPGPSQVDPESVLQDKRVAVVEVGAFIPPGARKGDRCDVIVKAIKGNRTTSLDRGLLYETSLRIEGADPADPGGAVTEYARAEGNLVVDPVYAINRTNDPQAAINLRVASIPGGAVVKVDRELQLRLRQSGWAQAAAIEKRITEFYQDFTVAKAQDSSLIYLYPPARYRGDWKHFTGVVRHMYLENSPEFLANKAAQLAAEAVKPGAFLEDISYALEALGSQAAGPYLPALIANPNPDISYAAARAGAFLDDTFAQEQLIQIARNKHNPWQLAAIEDFRELPATPFIDAALADLLSDEQPLVRIAAYNVLVHNNDSHIYSQTISSPADPSSSFKLDTIDCSGPPLIYATRIGEARVAIFGKNVAMNMPVTFAAFDERLTISTSVQRPRFLTIYYRGDDRPQPVSVLSTPDLGQLIAHLGGLDDAGPGLCFGEVVAVVQSMAASDTLADGKRSRAQFVLQELPAWLQRVNRQPGLSEPLRPEADEYVVPATLPVVDKAPAATQPGKSH